MLGQVDIRMLDDGEIEHINRVSIKVLSEVGVVVHHDELRRILARNGARVEGECVKLPPQLIREALAMAPKVVRLADRRGKEMLLEEGNLIWAAGHNHYPQVLDLDGSRHPTTVEDAIRMTRLIDTLPRFDVIHVVGGPLQGVPAPVTNLRSIAIFFENSHKHGGACPCEVVDAEFWLDLAEITTKGGDLGREPTISMLVSTTSPLMLDPTASQVMMEAIKRGVPIRGLSGPMAGATTPITLAGTLVLMNAEMIFLVTAAQCVREAAPVIYGGVGAVMNLKTGRISMGSPEFPMLTIAHAQLGRHHQLPTYAPVAVTDATRVDVQAGGEWMIQLIFAMASRLQYSLVSPSVDNGTVTSPEALLLASDFLDIVARVFKGITVSEDTLAHEAIARVGPGGHFLQDQHTFRNLRSGEHHYDGSFERGGSLEPSDAALYRARERINTILSQHVPDVSDAQVEEIERYVDRRSKDLLR